MLLLIEFYSRCRVTISPSFSEKEREREREGESRVLLFVYVILSLRCVQLFSERILNDIQLRLFFI